MQIKFKKRVPTIFFTTRTHKQITNVLKEYKKTPYAATARFFNNIIDMFLFREINKILNIKNDNFSKSSTYVYTSSSI
jgi:hypothetical protein